MIEIVVASGVVGFVAAAAGTIVATAVQSNENKNVDRRLSNHDVALSLHTVQIQEIKSRAHCGPCNEQDELRTKLADERHTEMLKRLQGIDRTVEKCFQDFIKELRKP